MAEDIRGQNPDLRSVEQRRLEIIKECTRQEESCLYTSTQLYMWLREIRWQRRVLVVVPLVLGGIAGLAVLKGIIPEWIIAVMAFIAGLGPALADALKIETSIDEASRLAAEYKAMEGRFRRNANLTVLTDVDKASQALEELMDRMDVARSSSLTPPERLFKKARVKIKAGHYDFTVDGATFSDGDGKPSR